ELLAVGASDGSGIDKREGCGMRDGGWGGNGKREHLTGNRASGHDRVEHCQQAAPRVANDVRAVEAQLPGDGGQVFDVRLPGYWRRIIRTRLAAPTLVVKHQLVVLGE